MDKVRQRAEPNPLLENYFHEKTRFPSKDDVSALCKKTTWSERKVQVWFRRRRNQGRPGLRKRFCEASWRCVFYLFAFIFGIVTLYDKPWVYDLRQIWSGFPKQSMLPSQYWYYILEVGFYISLVLSLAFDVKRKDFQEQVIHHIATLTLQGFSWTSNYIRIGTLVMAVHDSADIFLEGGKMFNYAKWQQAANVMFVLFTVTFTMTRLIIFPFWLIHCTWVYPVELFAPFFGYYFFNVMLVVLLVLNIYWALLISRMVYKLIFAKVRLLVLPTICMLNNMKQRSELKVHQCAKLHSLCLSLVHSFLCGSYSFCSWRGMTEVMKRRMIATHRRTEATNPVK
ncbi:uncharacterized protein V6R79_001126 [Siganus canaliculatus]